MSQIKKPASPFKNRNFIIVLIMLVMLFVMFPLTGQDKEQNLTRTEFLAMMGDSTKVITELSLQKTPDGIIIERLPKPPRTRAPWRALRVPTMQATPATSQATCSKSLTSRLPHGKCSRA